MKKRTLILTLLTIISVVNTYSQKELKVTNMHLFPEGKLVDDSNRTRTFTPFYLSDQVTNIIFREFWNYANSNPGKELEWVDISKTSDITSKPQPIIKKINYSELVKISINKEKWPSDNYFESEEYNNSPVIGVSKDLARYFCMWWTYKFNANLTKNEMNSSSNLYLPSDSQIEYAKKTEPSFFSENEVGFRVAITE